MTPACPHDERHPEDHKCPSCGAWVSEVLPRDRPDFTPYEERDGFEGEDS